MRQPTRLVRDSTDRYKLKISLPGGRYQLSLDDRAVILLTDQLDLSARDVVPDPFVPLFIAMGDAWFPRQRDVDSVIQDLPQGGDLSSSERSAFISYLTESRVPKRNEGRVRTVLNDSPLAGEIDPADLTIQELPSIPDVLNRSETQDAAATDAATSSDDRVAEPASDAAAAEVDQAQSESDSDMEDDPRDTLEQIPGIGPHRAGQLADGGVDSLEMLAESRPVDLAEVTEVSEDIAAVAIEGARELLGHVTPARERLKRQTDIERDVFSPALSSLAASGVPASEAVPTLRVLYGPTVADIDEVSGQQAYFLWEAGYQTPYDVIEASPDELCEVFQIGAKTAPEIQSSARDLLEVDNT
jgi:predicted flap endonuclease-1-like 5' DNA nuclease